jgi:hypothetical protein
MLQIVQEPPAHLRLTSPDPSAMVDELCDSNSTPTPKGEGTSPTIVPELVVPMPGAREEFSHWSTSYDNSGACGPFSVVVEEPAVPLKR